MTSNTEATEAALAPPLPAVTFLVVDLQFANSAPYDQ